MIVRNATPNDFAEILRMARKFYATTSYARFSPISAVAVVGLAEAMMLTGTMLIAEHNGQVVGMAGLMIVPFYFNPEVRTAHEVVWWVDPDAQGAGAGKALLAAVEPACRAAGAMAVQMIHLENSPPRAAALYERAGYRYSESCYTKEL